MNLEIVSGGTDGYGLAELQLTRLDLSELELDTDLLFGVSEWPV